MKWKAKGYKSIKEAVDALSGGLADSFLHRASFGEYPIANSDKAASLLQDFARKDIPVTIVGDYDADGICSTAIMKLFLDKLGFSSVKTRLPKRMSEGYGMSAKIVDEIEDGLIVTVDNGIAAIDAIKKAKEKRLTVIVTDHHLPVMKSGKAVLPEADLIVDPKAEPWIETNGARSRFDGYCGAGLAFKIAMQVFWEDTAFMNKLACFAAIATVADVMPLTEDNRNIYHAGIGAMRVGAGTAGMNALVGTLSSNGIVFEGDIGFKLAPMLNAPGRLRDDGAADALRAVLCENPVHAFNYINDLKNDNEGRKIVKKFALERAYAQIEANGFQKDNPVVVADPGTGEGIVGLVAGDISETLGVTSFCFTKKGNTWKGSARAGDGDNVKAALDKAYEIRPDVLLGYGGHAGAAGLSIPEDKLSDFRSVMLSILPPAKPKSDTLTADMEISEKDIPAAAAELSRFAPFGEGNPAPVFIIRNVSLLPNNGQLYTALKDDHVKFRFCGGEGIGFGLLNKYLALETPAKIDIAGTIGFNAFRGNLVPQVEIIDLKCSEEMESASQNNVA